MRIRCYTRGQHITTITSGAREPPWCVNISHHQLVISSHRGETWQGCSVTGQDAWRDHDNRSPAWHGTVMVIVTWPHDDLLLIGDPRPCGQPQSQPPCLSLSQKLQDQENGRSWMWSSLLQVNNFHLAMGLGKCPWKQTSLLHFQL